MTSWVRRALGLASFAVLVAGVLTAPTARAVDVQLVANPSVETVSAKSTALPASWTQMRLGKHRATFGYPSSGGATGSRYVTLSVTSWTSGGAFWRFAPVAVQAGQTLVWSDRYRATVPSTVVAEFRTSRGTATYLTLGSVAPASAWTTATFSVTVPAGISSMSVGHRLERIGRLDVDDTMLVASSTPPPPPPPPPPIPGLPDRFLAGYLESWNLALPSTLPTQYEILYHAFATIGTDGTASMYLNGVSRSQLASEYKARRAAGLPTLLSIGGAGGAMSGLGTAAHQDRFLATVTPMIDEFGFSGIDWDLEQGVPGGISPSGLAAVSRALRVRYGPQFLITMAPYGAAEVEGPMKVVARDLQSTGDLAYVGFQFYNDNAPTSSSVLAEMRSWLVECGLRPDQFVLGFWAGPWDWPAGYVMLESTMATIYRDVRAAYPTLRGSYTWGIRGTDRVRNWAYATTMWPVVHGV